VIRRRRAAAAAAEDVAGMDPAWRHTMRPGTALFRFSALTFNTPHSLRSATRLTSGYAGLVVHSPLIATLLLDLLQRT
jgi:3-methylfumaryl-CoA hydratase